MYVELDRFDDAVRQFWLAVDSAGVDPEIVRSDLVRAYRDWARRLREGGRPSEAVRVLDEALARFPVEAVLLVEAGRARAAIRDWEGARIAFEDAISLEPELAAIIGDELDDVYRRLGGDGILTVEIPRDTRLIPADVWIDRKAHATLYLDSGASWSFITPDVAARLGVDPRRVGRHARFSTANGEVDLPVVVLDEVNFRGFVVRNVEAAVGELSGSLGGGVLGNNFLRHFTITIDRPNGRMTIQDPR